jgi:5S rRNA maturation endonuclease (ribonuclease M5)
MSLMEQIVKRGKLRKIKKQIDMPVLLKAINALDQKDAKRYGKELWSLCPNVDHDDKGASWSINIDPESDGFGTHNCFSCGFKGNFLTLTAYKLSHTTGKEVDTKQASEFITSLFSLDAIDEDTIYNLILEEREQMLGGIENPDEKRLLDTELPEEFELTPMDKDNEYYSYLSRPIKEGGRGLSYDLIGKYKIGYAHTGLYHHRIIIPFIQEGRLISFLARSILPPMDSKKKNGDEFVICPECDKLNPYGYRECMKCEEDLRQYVVKKARARYPKGSTMELMLWPYDELDLELDYVMLVEGAMDKLRLEKLGYKNVLCVFGNKVSDYQVELLQKHQKRIGKKLRVFVFPDADDGGKHFIDVANQKMKYSFDCYCIQLPWKPERWLDPGSATAKQIRSSVNKAEKLYKVHSRIFGKFGGDVW